MTQHAASPSPSPLLTGLDEIADRYDAFIIDIFGVLHNGLEPFPNTVETLKALKSAGKRTCLLSNTPRPAKGATEHMESMGISRDLFDEIMTSGEATITALTDPNDDFHRECGTQCWFIGTEKMGEKLEHLSHLNILDGPENASFILNSIPGTQKTEMEIIMAKLEEAVKSDLPMVCANPDMVVNVGDTQYKCAGTYAARYEEMGGRVVYHGKPHAPVYERCHALLGGTDKAKICAIGDAFHTDIHGANAFGIDSVLNLVGIHWDEITMDEAPHQADLEKLAQMIDTQPHKPTHIMTGFSW